MTRLSGGFCVGTSDSEILIMDDVEIHDLVVVEVFAKVRQIIPKKFGSTSIELIAMFNERYVIVIDVDVPLPPDVWVYQDHCHQKVTYHDFYLPILLILMVVCI